MNYYYTNLSNNRQVALYIATRELRRTSVYIKLRNGRSLNRLSTKQIVAKIKSLDKQYSQSISRYVGYLDSFKVAA
jgi:hypothetical protein